METELIGILVTFGLLSAFHALKKHYHFLYLKETDMRLRTIEKPVDLIMTHKTDLESFHKSRLLNEVMWTTAIPSFDTASKYENENAKRLSKRIRIVLTLFYMMLVLLIGQILKFSNII